MLKWPTPSAVEKSRLLSVPEKSPAPVERLAPAMGREIEIVDAPDIGRHRIGTGCRKRRHVLDGDVLPLQELGDLDDRVGAQRMADQHDRPRPRAPLPVDDLQRHARHELWFVTSASMPCRLSVAAISSRPRENTSAKPRSRKTSPALCSATTSRWRSFGGSTPAFGPRAGRRRQAEHDGDEDHRPQSTTHRPACHRTRSPILFMRRRQKRASYGNRVATDATATFGMTRPVAAQ